MLRFNAVRTFSKMALPVVHTVIPKFRVHDNVNSKFHIHSSLREAFWWWRCLKRYLVSRLKVSSDEAIFCHLLCSKFRARRLLRGYAKMSFIIIEYTLCWGSQWQECSANGTHCAVCTKDSHLAHVCPTLVNWMQNFEKVLKLIKTYVTKNPG